MVSNISTINKQGTRMGLLLSIQYLMVIFEHISFLVGSERLSRVARYSGYLKTH